MKKLQVTTLLICLFAFSAINTNAQTQGAGYALDFNGTTNYIKVTDDNSLDFGTSDFTIEAWINTDGSSDRQGIYSKRVKNGSTTLFSLRISNKLEFYIRSGGSSHRTFTGNTILLTGKWYHVAIVADRNGNAVFYINGVKETNTLDISSVGDVSTNNYAEIGKSNNIETNSSHRAFKGDMDEYRIWNRALTQTEIRNNMNKQLTGTEPGLVAYYRMNEGEDGTCEDGKDICDKSGNGNHGTKN